MTAKNILNPISSKLKGHSCKTFLLSWLAVYVSALSGLCLYQVYTTALDLLHIVCSLKKTMVYFGDLRFVIEDIIQKSRPPYDHFLPVLVRSHNAPG